MNFPWTRDDVAVQEMSQYADTRNGQMSQYKKLDNTPIQITLRCTKTIIIRQCNHTNVDSRKFKCEPLSHSKPLLNWFETGLKPVTQCLPVTELLESQEDNLDFIIEACVSKDGCLFVKICSLPSSCS